MNGLKLNCVVCQRKTDNRCAGEKLTKILPLLCLLRSICLTVFCKKVVFENYQNAQKNIFARVSFLIRLQTSGTVLKKRPWHKCFRVKFAKFLRTPFSIEYLQ